MLYFLILWIYCGRVPAFGWIWLVAGATAVGIGVGTGGSCINGLGISMPVGFRWIEVLFEKLGLTEIVSAMNSLEILNRIRILTVILSAVAAGFIIWFHILSIQGNRKASPGADYVIVLGAKVNGTVPSKALRSRIRTAFTYLQANPDAKAILTGGQGAGEDITEALCMQRELLALGIEEERLILEDRSRTTVENIAFASTFIKKKNIYLVIVTSDFHALRGRVLGRRAGFERVESLGAPSSRVMKLHYYTRETFSWLKFLLIR